MLLLHYSHVHLFIILIIQLSHSAFAFYGYSSTMRSISVSQSRLITIRYLTTTIITVGKKNGVEPWISDGCAEYEKRIGSHIELQTIFFKNDEALVDYIPSLRGTIIALDENGKEFTSREFSSYFYKTLETGGAHTSIIIGGFSGLPLAIKNKYPLISIGKMTWTHQMARLLLLEQIYRAIEIRKGSGYHKD